MNFKHAVELCRNHWIYITIVVVAAIAVGILITAATPKKYQAQLALYIASQGTSADNPSIAYQGSLLSQQRVKTYSELVTGPRITSAVISQLTLDTSQDDLAKEIKVEVPADSVLLNITATDRSATTAADIANSVGRNMVGLIAELEQSSRNAEPPVVARIVSPAFSDGRPVSPSWTINLIAAFAIGAVVGVGALLGRDYLDKTVRSAEDLEKLTEHAVLGQIRRASPSELVGTENANSEIVEDYRKLRTNLRYLSIDTYRRVILLTSAVPGEGKTTSSIELGRALAQAGFRTVIVEADLRRPRLAERLSLEASVGVTSVLTGHLAARDALQRTSQPNLGVLCSGPLPPNPSELLGSESMKRMLDELKNAHDYVLVDSAPLVPVSDGAALAPQCDGTVLLVRFGKTQQRDVEAAIRSLERVDADLLGAVLTAVPPTKSGDRYQDYSYGSYNSELTPADDRIGVTDTIRRPSPASRLQSSQPFNKP